MVEQMVHMTVDSMATRLVVNLAGQKVSLSVGVTVDSMVVNLDVMLENLWVDRLVDGRVAMMGHQKVERLERNSVERRLRR